MARRSASASPRWLWRLVLVPLPFLVALPFLGDPSFSLIDDGVTLDVARRMDANEMREKGDGSGERHSRWWFVETEHGRVRPVYWWWLWLNHKLFGLDCRAWHWGLAAAIALVLQLAYSISYRVTGSVLASVLAGALMVAFHPCAEAFTRLGLGETPMLLLLGVSVLCLVRGYSLGPRVPEEKQALFWVCLVGSVVPLCLAYFVKETSVVMLPVSVVMLAALWRRGADGRSKALLVGYLAANVAAAAALAGHVLPTLGSGEYSRLYNYDRLDWALQNAGQYVRYVVEAWLVLPVVAAVSLVVRLVRARRRGGLAGPQRWQLVWIAFLAGYVVVLAPWGGSSVAIARYLLPLAMFGGLFMGQEVAWLVQRARQALAEPGAVGTKPRKGARKRRATRDRRVLGYAALVLLVVAVAGTAGVNAWLARKAVVSSYRLEAANGNLLRLLAAEAPRDRPLYVNLSTDEAEIRYEIGLHLAMIHGREDFRRDRSVQFLSNPAHGGERERMSLPEPGEWVLAPEGNYRYAMRFAEAVWLADWKRVALVDRRGWRWYTHEPRDVAELTEAYDDLDCGWVVIEAGPKAAVLEPLPEEYR